MAVKLSVIILVGGKYDPDLLKKCLASVAWADEVIKIETTGKPGSFADWRNEGAGRAKGEWLLYVDSDERVIPGLQKEIVSSIKYQVSSIAAFAIPRKNILLGREMRHGGWWPDYVVRLMRKDALVEWRGKLHEQPEIRGEVGKLKTSLIHVSHRTIAEMVEKTNEWSEIEAGLLLAAGHPKMTWWRFLSAGFREFWFRGVLKLGFLDGPIGAIEVVYQIFSRLVTYSKLWEKQLSLIPT